MKTNLNLNGTTIEVTINEKGLISVCSHWELLLDMERGGLVEKANRGGRGIPADYRLAKGLMECVNKRAGYPVFQIGFSKFAVSACPVEDGKMVIS